MKKVLLGVLALGLSFTSCSSDDDNGSVATVVGKWDPDYNIVNGVKFLDPDQDCDNLYIEFLNNGNIVSHDYTDCELEESYEEGTWKVDGNTLSLSYVYGEDVETDVFEIRKLTNSEIELFIKADFDENGVEDEIGSHLTRVN
ncbi:lipocalin family protein [Aureivirga sp. CE67]|uniref:lipocalin family protein n=1 Tax=Aureivirga sp. CE67 TaxID=1788983 RepID=UPI0018CB2279|nr:lipocalin family protein [Aureivirga sp. CE67]